MVHLGALPGAPAFTGDFDAVLAAAARDAEALGDAGFDAVMVENFGDAPFFADDVPKVTVAAMARAVAEVQAASGLPVGVNVLRNDALAALAVAAVSGAALIRVNVLSGTMYTDQGPIVGNAAEVARSRAVLCPDTAILADVFVKHAVPPPGLRIEEAVRDLAERGGADAVVVSGTGTGLPVAGEDLKAVRAETDLPIYVGSGVTRDTVRSLLENAHGVIAGTSLKAGGAAEAAVDPRAAAALVAAARGTP
jgi:membrane complex biogenesis BtpA family protein